MLKENGIKMGVFAVQMPGDPRAVRCEGKGRRRYFLFGSRAEEEAFQNVSCSLSPPRLISTQRALLRNLRGGKLLSQASREAPMKALALAGV